MIMILNIFKRNLEAMGKKNDLLICLSTSGNSKNIFECFKIAKKKKNLLFFLGEKRENMQKSFRS